MKIADCIIQIRTAIELSSKRWPLGKLPWAYRALRQWRIDNEQEHLLNRGKQKIKALLLTILILMLPCVPSVMAKPTAEPPLVLMLLWRGMTEAEIGFQDYFAANGLPVRYEIWNTNKDRQLLRAMIEQIPELGPDLIYTFGTTVSVAVLGTVRQSTSVGNYAPQIFNIVADPAGAGLVQEMPETDISGLTGVSHNVPVDAQLEAMKELDDFHSIAALFNPLEENSRLALAALSASAEKAGIAVEKVAINEADFAGEVPAIGKILTRIKQSGIELVYLPSDSLLISNARQVVSHSHNAGLLTFSATEAPIRKGGALVGIVAPYRNVGQLAGFKARQIIFGNKKANEIAVETLSRFSLIVNMKAAHQLNYYPPVTMMQFAEVIQ